ncbi:hypothetical protein MBEHAL_1490 [Halarchaeum acidiphilum MH1-52-1]|uniref:Uncharacterized protein n=1 Tax=Halarchaeum acidiphilum MH1-52-1 TaxID=1261545 RepID=U2YUN2_9EURY|nr:hypothetical protein [Halarchaeum acidiphilum]GAD52730.1 hypothetical protein MBEHAL_1490 [Halarchaeum acidiphilum MH1-52-1]
MAYDRSVSAADHALAPESVWNIRLPELRFGPDATDELAYQIRVIGVPAGAHGLLVTDETLVDVGHADRVRDALHNWG